MVSELGVLCWHRLVIRRRRWLCEHCGVEIVECLCVNWRVPDGQCVLCMGSGYLAVARSNREKFEEYLARDTTKPVAVEDGW